MVSKAFGGCRRAGAVVALLVAVSTGCSGGSGDEDGGDDEGAGWRVDSCVRQVGGPETIPDDVSAEEREVMEAQQQFEPVACSDGRAIARITDIGAELELGEEITDDGCPDDSDVAYEAPDPITGLESHVACARYLEPPHPGDPGGGAGDFLVGDCIFVSSTPSATILNDRVDEMPCDVEGWFGTVVAMAPDPGSCPPEALSRIAVPGRPGEVLCLAPDSATATGGIMATPGECLVYEVVAGHLPPMPSADCTEIDAYRLDGFADPAGACPGGADPELITGYDRELCLSR